MGPSSLPAGDVLTSLNALPSPSEHGPLLSPPHIAQQSPASPLRPIPPEPAHVPLAAHTASTPPTEAPSPHLPNTMNLIVGGALAPMHPVLPRRLPSQLSAGLRLPSFHSLGIAAPHPDRFGSLTLDDIMSSTVIDGSAAEIAASKRIEAANFESFEALSSPSAQLEPPRLGPKRPSGAVQTPFRHDVATLTPPAESGEPIWHSVASISDPAPMDSPATDPGNTTSHSLESGIGTGSQSPPPEGTPTRGSSTSSRSWIDGALEVLLTSLRSASIPNNPLRVLSHALPSPSATGYIFPTIIGAMHNSTPTQSTEWINVFHAIQGRFNLADLPTSPPSTPGPPIGGDDYFTRKVFDSAVPISDYQEELSSLPRSPRPVVPPSSINLSIVERYIPPTSAHEFRHMFNPNGPSILVDRLVELSPDRGSLVFIYPTRAGAETFMKQYLGPILDPLLRSIVVVNGLSSDLSRTLGTMMAANQLPDFDQIKRSMTVLCNLLGQRSSNMPAFHGTKATFTVVHSSKAEVRLSRGEWSKDWWTRQEKPRIRDAMAKYAQEAQKKSSNEHVERSPTPTELVQQLVDGILKRPYPEGQVPRNGIEVSIFVIQRSE